MRPPSALLLVIFLTCLSHHSDAQVYYDLGEAIVTSNVSTISFDAGISDPVVFAQPTSKDEPNNDPVVVMIKNVDPVANTFEIFLRESITSDRIHGPEVVSWLVVSEGIHDIDGRLYHAGIIADSTSAVRTKDYDLVSFDSSITAYGTGRPVIFTMVQTLNSNPDDLVLTRIRNLDKGFHRFETGMDMDESHESRKDHGTEDVGWVVLGGGETEIFSGGISRAFTVVDPTRFDSTSKIQNIPDTYTFSDFSAAAEVQVFVAMMQTVGGSDPSWIRRTDKTMNAVDFYIEEDTRRESEQNHAAETVGLFALACDTPVLTVGHNGPFSNAEHYTYCPRIYFAIDVGVVEYILVTATFSGGIPDVFLRDATPPTEALYDDADTSNANPTVDLQLTNPSTLAYLGLFTSDTAYTVNITITVPVAEYVPIVTPTPRTTTAHWYPGFFNISGSVASLTVKITPPDTSSPLELYLLQGAIPTLSTATDSSTVPNGDGDYLLTVSGPLANTDYYFGVYSTVTSEYPVEVIVLPPPPSISGIDPTTGITDGGYTLEISGSNLGSASVTTVNFGDTSCDSLTFVGGAIQCEVPAGNGTNIQISVITFGVESNAVSFSYLPPEITSITVPGSAANRLPTAGGAVITLYGDNFGLAGIITVAGQPCPVVPGTYKHGEVQCISPEGVGADNLRAQITVGGQTSVGFTVQYEQPVLSSFSPSVGSTQGGESITFVGTDFGTPGSATVDIGPNSCPITFNNHTHIVCTLAEGQAADLNVALTVGTLAFSNPSSLRFSYGAPSITSLNPSNGTTEGLILAVLGSNFGQLNYFAATATVRADSDPCPVIYWSHTFINCSLPPGQGTGVEITVTVSSQVSDAAIFDYNAPVLTSVSPTLIPTVGGTPLTIRGRSLGTVDTLVSTDGSSCPITFHNDTMIICTSLEGEGANLDLTVTVSLQVSNTLTYSYIAPTIDDVQPGNSSTAGSQVVQITGSNLGSTGQVRLGSPTGSVCTVTGLGYDHSLIECSVPAGQGSFVPLYVVSGGQASSPFGFSYNPPTITSIDPAEAPTQGGTELDVHGLSFGTYSRVLIDGVDCPLTPSGQSHTRLTCAVPEGRGTFLNLTVVAADQSDSIFTFNYSSPSITSVTAGVAGFRTDGTVLVTIAGSSFDTSGRVFLGDTLCDQGFAGSSYDHEQILCGLPEGQGKDIPLIVETVDNRNSSVTLISYNPPTVNSFSTAGDDYPTAGGVTLTLVGSSFGLTPTVSVGGFACPITSNSHTVIECDLPPGQGVFKAIIVSVGGQTGAALTLDYNAPVISNLIPTTGLTSALYNLTVKGVDLGTPGSATISVGEGVCPVIWQNQTHIICNMPEGTGNELVRVDVSGQESTGSLFSYSAPSISYISPEQASTSGGDTLTIVGDSFGSGVSSLILIDGSSCTELSHNHTVITCRIPAGTGDGHDVTVTIDSKTSNPVTFSYLPPRLNTDGTGISPANGTTAGGTVITLRGTDFGIFSKAFVTVGGQTCVLDSGAYTQTSLECTVPEGLGADLDVELRVDGQTSNALNFSYNAPRINSVLPVIPRRTAGLEAITLIGSDFGTAGTVLVGGSPCSVAAASQYTHDSITCLIPEGQDTVDIVLTVGEQESNIVPYTYAAPSFIAFAPANGPTQGGITLTVTGSNFGLTGQLTIGDRNCSVDNLGANGVYTHTRIECELPAGAGADQSVRIQVGSQSANADVINKFDYDRPTVTSVTPNEATTNGSATVTVRGTNFGVEGNLTIVIGPQVCTELTRSHTSAECSLPVGSGANKLVQVIVEGQASTAQYSLFSYEAPVISSVSSPACIDDAVARTTTKCSTEFPSNLTITGYNFGAPGLAAVGIDGASCSSVDNDLGLPHRILYCNLTAGLGQDLPLTVTVDGQTSNAKLISYAGPLIYDGTLRETPSGSISTVPNNVDIVIGGGNTVEFGGEFLRLTAEPTITYGLSGSSPLQFTCVPIYVNFTYANCTTQAGVGRDLVFRIDDGVQISPESGDTVTYPKPTILPISIRTSGTARSTEVAGAFTEGEIIFFDATNVGSIASHVSVTYGPPGNPTEYDCNVVDITDNSNGNYTIKCRTSPGEGSDYVFQVTALNYASDEGTDTYSYPEAPKVLNVTGCTEGDGVNNPANATVNCPTEGGTLLTIIGSAFSELSSVKIGINDCIDVDQINSKKLTCTLPPGTGLDLPVIVASGALFSRTNDYLSYSLASLSTISGCETTDGVNTADCGRAGGDTVVVTGTNFGATGATVLIGGEECQNVTHDGTKPHRKLTCEIPEGSRTSRSVLLIQDRGEISSNRLQLSYRQCEAGTYDASTNDVVDVLCTNCSAGSFTSGEGQVACVSCEEGFYAPNERMTSCLKCAKGTFSVRVGGEGAVNCTSCPSGRFSNADGQGDCVDCPSGTYGPSTGRTVCLNCPTGTENPDTGATECTNCTAGSFASATRTVSCSLCPVGSFSAVDRSSACTTCSAGTFAATAGLTKCTDCTVGKAVAASGQPACVSCDSGFFSNDTGLDVCLTCPVGKFSLKVGSLGPTECSPCDEGEYIGASGQATCLKCSKGTYQPGTGKSVCAACPLGQFADQIGLTACFNCTAGSIAASVGTLTCEDCPAGSFSAVDMASECTSCSAGRFQPLSGRTSCSPCAAGDAQSSVGQPNCEPCDVGTFTSEEAQLSCDRCPAGFVAAGTGSTECTPCDPGDFAEAEAQGVCKACPVGTFSDASNSTECTKCPAGAITASEGLTECTNCSAGFFSPAVGGQACERCAVGRFSPLPGQSSCTSCPVGRAQPNTNQADCVSCVAGKFSSSTGQALCLDCPSGSFSNSSGSSFCYQCPLGRFQSSARQTECLPCPVGRFNPSIGQPVCIACPVGKFAVETGLSECASCPVGKFAGVEESTACTNCTAGRFADEEDSLVCKECDVGTFNSQPGLDSCASCPAGRFQASTGETECVVCPVGRAQPAIGQAACALCPVGTYQPFTDQEECVDCPAGMFSDESESTECTNCTQGRFSVSDRSVSCDACPVGRFAEGDGASECTFCPRGKFQSESGKTTCASCPVGRANAFLAQATCVACRGGTFANDTGRSACTLCPAGTASSFEAEECTACAAGRFTNVAGLDACIDCPVGRASAETGLTECETCAPGKFASAARSLQCFNCTVGRSASGFGSQVCTICGLGRYAAGEGMSGCADCEKGKFQDHQGETVCQDCARGRFALATGQALCDDCDVGFFSANEGAVTCDACPAGSAQASSGRSTCSDCNLGEAIGASGQALCTECDAGRFSNDTGLDACLSCPAGTFSQKDSSGNGASICSPCPVGTFSAGVGQPLCLACEFGTFANETGRSSCDACPAGRSAPFSGASECEDCPEGTFSTRGAANCEACPPGTASSTAGATSCALCPTGRFMNATGASNCTLCGEGTFMRDRGALVCKECPIGTFSNTRGLDECADCSPGRFQNQVGSRSCVACPRGRFAILPGESECDFCEPGSFNNDTGRGNCTLCGPGTATSAFGSTSCPGCPLGRFTSADGRTACEFCGAGTFANVTGLEECTACAIGKHQPSRGGEECDECSTGRYQDSPGQAECKACLRGEFANVTGLTLCAPCSTGTFQPGLGGESCDECPSGRYQDSPGQETCKACRRGEFGNATGLTQCLECAEGKFQPGQGGIECTNCSVGRFAAVTGLSTCQACEEGKFRDFEGATDCDQCAAGSYAVTTGQESCQACPAGTAISAPGQSACLQCEPGRFAQNTSATSCDACPTGRFQAAKAQSSCFLCGIGTFQDDEAKSSCDLCPVGKFGEMEGASNCTLCSPGSETKSAGLTNCTLCLPGFANNRFGTECLECSDDSVARVAGLTECTFCGDDAAPNAGKTECECNEGLFLPDNEDIGQAELPCRSCPAGGACETEGVKFSTLEASPGWWRSSLDDTYFLRCLVRRYCTGGREYDENGVYVGSACLENREGPLCALCKEGFYETAGGECIECPTSAGSYAFFVFIALMVVMFVILSFYVILRSGKDDVENALDELHEQELAENLSNLSSFPSEMDNMPGINDAGKLDQFVADPAQLDAMHTLEMEEGLSGSEYTGTGSYVSDEDGSYTDGSYTGSGSYVTGDEYSDEGSYTGSGSYSDAGVEGGDTASAAEAKASKRFRSARMRQSRKETNRRELQDQPRTEEGFVIITGAPPPEPNFTYALKIALSFAQIVTNLGTGLEIQWPSTFTSFVLYFDIANFDFIVGSSFSCVDSLGYYKSYLIVVLTPVVIFMLLGGVYLLPRKLGCCGYDKVGKDEMLRYVINFWRMFLYFLFLIYPGVSSTVLRHYICKDIYGESFLLTDLSVRCYTKTWNDYAFASIVLVAIYPLGIPLFFYAMLALNRDSLHLHFMKAQYGFLYAGYRNTVWWFEVADSIHKLSLTSLIAFLPRATQLSIGMVVAVLYLIVLLLVNPYLRDSDDSLHLLSQVEIFLIMCAGNVIYNLPTTDLSHKEDIALSVVLIGVTVLFLLVFFGQGAVFLKSTLENWVGGWRDRRAQRKMEDGGTEMAAPNLSDGEGSGRKKRAVDKQLEEEDEEDEDYNDDDDSAERVGSVDSALSANGDDNQGSAADSVQSDELAPPEEPVERPASSEPLVPGQAGPAQAHIPAYLLGRNKTVGRGIGLSPRAPAGMPKPGRLRPPMGASRLNRPQAAPVLPPAQMPEED